VRHLTYVGHATVLLELGGIRLLTDPVLRGRIAHLRRRGPEPDPDVQRGIDAVLISHLHHDHLDLPSLRRLGAAVPLVVPRGAGDFLLRAGFSRVSELAPGESTTLGDVEVAATRAEHENRRWPLGGPVAEAIGFEIRGSRRIYFAGDTGLFPEMEELRGGLDVALLPVWGWGSRIGPGHLGPEAAARAVVLLQPRIAIPIHWGTLASPGLARRPELLREPPREFAAHLASLAPEVEVRVVEPGDSLELT
jgi:L-ascorbate metabolism protein UlaG (beta-lactamase superfamily)